MGRFPLAAVLAVLAAAGCGHHDGDPDCSGPPPPAPGDGFAPDVEVAVRSATGTTQPIAENDPVPLTLAPQGGFVVLAGFRSRSLPACLQLKADIRDETDNHVLGLESRPVQMQSAGGGYQEPYQPEEFFNWANIAACPNAGATRDIHDQTYLLEIEVTDKSGNTYTGSRHVSPACQVAAFKTQCECYCAATYDPAVGCPAS